MHWALEWPGDDRDLVEAAGKLGVFASIGKILPISEFLEFGSFDKDSFKVVNGNFFNSKIQCFNEMDELLIF